MRKLRSMTNNLKQQLGASNSEKSTLNRTVADLQAELKTVVAERDSLRNAGTNTEASKELTSQLESVRQEKAGLEKALADEKASKAAPTPPAPSPDQSLLIVSSCTHALLSFFSHVRRRVCGLRGINSLLRKRVGVDLLVVTRLLL